MKRDLSSSDSHGKSEPERLHPGREHRTVTANEGQPQALRLERDGGNGGMLAERSATHRTRRGIVQLGRPALPHGYRETASSRAGLVS